MFSRFRRVYPQWILESHFLKNAVDYYFAENIENGKVIRVDFVNFTDLTREEEK